MRLPSLRHPRSLYDVLTISLVGVVVMALALDISRVPIVRTETVAGFALIVLWNMWAITTILDEARTE